MVARADETPAAAMRPEVVRHRKGVCGLPYLVRRGHGLGRHHVVIDQQREVLADGLPVHQPPRLDGGLLGVARTLHHDAAVQRPLRCIGARVVPQHVGVGSAKHRVLFELALYLLQEGLRPWPAMREDAHRDVRRAEDVLNGQGEGDDGRLVVLACPQVEMPVGRGRHLAASGEAPVVVSVLALEKHHKQKEQV